MPLVNILHNLQKQIHDLAPVLELFVDQTIQPSVNDCEKLQQHLSKLQENIAIYKYNMVEKELSPIFNIHAKISEKNISDEETELRVPETRASKPEEKPANHDKPGQEATRSVKPLSVSLNDKFRFINELFAQNTSEYNIALEQLSNLGNWSDTEIYLNSLKSLYGWKENSDVVKHLYSLSKKRFE